MDPLQIDLQWYTQGAFTFIAGMTGLIKLRAYWYQKQADIEEDRVRRELAMKARSDMTVTPRANMEVTGKAAKIWKRQPAGEFEPLPANMPTKPVDIEVDLSQREESPNVDDHGKLVEAAANTAMRLELVKLVDSDADATDDL